MLLLFTDLDGTLIDHHTYSAAGSVRALAKLKEQRVPIVFCSSKTFVEQRALQIELGVEGPLIVENGAGIAIPEAWFAGEGPHNSFKSANMPWQNIYPGFQLLSMGHATADGIRALLRKWRHQYGWPLFGYADATEAEISRATGLVGPAIHRAAQRHFSETLLRPLHPETETVLRQVAHQHQLALIRGGRFITVQPEATDKGRALRWMVAEYSRRLGIKCSSAAVGDSPNDLAMLQAADMAALVQRPEGDWHNIDFPGLQRIPAPGPEGFSRAVDWFLSQLTKTPRI